MTVSSYLHKWIFLGELYMRIFWYKMRDQKTLLKITLHWLFAASFNMDREVCTFEEDAQYWYIFQ